MKFSDIAINSEFTVNKTVFVKIDEQRARNKKTGAESHFESDTVIGFARGTILKDMAR